METTNSTQQQTQTTTDVALNPSRIMQIGMGFLASKVLLTAVKLGLFTLLAPEPLTGSEVKQRLGLGCSDRHVDRKSTRLNSSHLVISYAVFCLKKKKTN